MISPLLNKYYAFGFWLVNVLLAYMNIYLFTLNSSFQYGEVRTQNYIDSEPKKLQNSAEVVITKPYTIAVLHKMTAMGVDELDQDIRMAHRIGQAKILDVNIPFFAEPTTKTKLQAITAQVP